MLVLVSPGLSWTSLSEAVFELCGSFAAGVTKWVKNWKLNGWRLKAGGQVTNKDDFVKLDRLNEQLEVVWVNDPDPAAHVSVWVVLPRWQHQGGVEVSV